MALPDIQLDDRRFEDIVAEAKRRIPSFAPEWTDLNESDPGVTLLHLFAWLTEMTLYRLNQVPKKNYLKFLELIGLEPRLPAPAHAELTFKLTSRDISQPVPIPQGTRVASAEGGEGGPVIFETDDNLNAVGAELAAVQSFDGARYENQTPENRVEGKYFYPLSRTPQRHAALYLGFDRAYPPGKYPLRFHAYTKDLIAEGQGLRHGKPDTPLPAHGIWEYWAGGQRPWRPLKVNDDDTHALTRTGTVKFEAPTGWAASKQGLLRRAEDEELFWLRFRIEQELGEGYLTAPRLEAVLMNTIGATNAVTERDEPLGASEGLPNQLFRLTRRPVLPETLELEVDEGEGLQLWEQVTDFAGSRRDDPHYLLDLATGTITFGDGRQGKIPRPLLRDSTDRAQVNIHARRYRWGGGARGNAAIGQINGLQTAIPFMEGVTNHRPGEGGVDQETLEATMRRAPLDIRSRSRAVTAGDFEYLATQTPGGRIARAKALPGKHPDFGPRRPASAAASSSDVPVPGVVTVLVVPRLPVNKPMPNEMMLQQVARQLQEHSLLTTEVYVAAPRYKHIEVEAEVIALRSADSGTVAKQLLERLLRYFHPLPDPLKEEGWEFGGPIYLSEVYRQILEHDGVARVQAGSLRIRIDGALWKENEDIPLEPDELVYSDKHRLTVKYDDGRNS